MSLQIGIVDDHPIVRAGLRDFLSMQEGLCVAGMAADAEAALNLVRTKALDVLVLDLDLPGRSGLDALAALRGKAPDVGVLVFTGYSPEQYAVKLFRQGASAFIHKSCDVHELVTAIRVVATGRRYIPPALAELLASQFERRVAPPHASLTDRELQVLLKLARGVRTELIADQLALSVKTVSTYRSRLLAKLDLGSNGDLTYYALKHQLLE